MNYDQTDIPAVYDRGRDHGPELLELWMKAVSAHLEGRPVGTILDLGCGTGRFSEALARHFSAEVVGIDPSLKMLDVARGKQTDARVHYQPGRAEALPLQSHSIDLIFMSMSYHHFSDPGLAARECRRVLREDGRVFVRTASREQAPWYPYVPFFPSSRPLLDAYLPTVSNVREIFEAAGFRTQSWEIIRQTIAPDWVAYAEKIATGADSILARLDPQDFQQGLAVLRIHAARADVEAIVEPIDLFVFSSRTSWPT